MTLHFLRRTLTSFSLKHESSNFINLPNFPFFSTQVTQIEKPNCEFTNYLITHHNFSQKNASKTATCLTPDYKNSDLVLGFLKSKGISGTQLEELVVRHPRVLAVDINKSVGVKVSRIKDLGFSDDELVDLLCSVPIILTLSRSVERVVLAISVLQSILGSNCDVIKLLKLCNWFLNNDLDKSLLPNIQLMEKCGISKLQIRQTLLSFPRFFLVQPDFMKDCMRRVDSLGLGRNSKMYIHGVRAVSSMTLEKWASKVKLFETLGFREDDILSMFQRTPQVLTISERKILEVSKLFLSSGSVDVSYLVQHSELLIYSAAFRIKPRLDIINVLLSKNLLHKEPRPTTLCKISDKKFIEKFVLPYASEIGDIGKKFLVSTGFGSSFGI
ncbi:uncharacterized protein LOC110706556 [Chenopodium quinoa]|uniref:Uncharacterized protein n=1 Tax=Chenopodium quinoa TaxID=63459 RepID=A0A803ME38_CHEQI|nr:uncharacterized protein LOC110706556 [Chenopodium quinoa]